MMSPIPALTAPSSATSTMDACTSPDLLIWSTARAFLSALVPQITTFAPCCARPSAIPRPMPPLPPVTSATLPVRSNRFFILLPSLAFEFRFAFLQESGNALGKILRAPGQLLALALFVQLLLVGVVWTLPIEAPRRRQSDRRSFRETLGEFQSLVEKRTVLMHSVDETPLQSLLGRKSFGQEREFPRAGKSDEPRQKPRRTAVRDQPDPRERLQEVRRFSSEDQIAHQGEAHADACRRAIHGGYDWHPDVSNSAQEGMENIFQGMADAGRPAAALGEIGAGTEPASFARNHQCAKAAVRTLDEGQCVGSAFHQRR